MRVALYVLSLAAATTAVDTDVQFKSSYVVALPDINSRMQLKLCKGSTSPCLHNEFDTSVPDVPLPEALTVDLSHKNLTLVKTVPVGATTIDLSFNMIGGVSTMPYKEDVDVTKLKTEFLNISNNRFWALTFEDMAKNFFAPTLKTLDISHNPSQITANGFAQSDRRNFSIAKYTPQLESLYMRDTSDQYVFFMNTSLPKTLKLLDVSQNPRLVLAMDKEVFDFFKQPGFTLIGTTNASATKIACNATLMWVLNREKDFKRTVQMISPDVLVCVWTYDPLPTPVPSTWKPRASSSTDSNDADMAKELLKKLSPANTLVSSFAAVVIAVAVALLA